MKKIFYIALTAVLGLAGTSCDREKLTYDSEPGEISGKTGTLDLSSFDAIPNNDIKEIEKKPVSRAVDTGDFTVQIFRTDNGSETLENIKVTVSYSEDLKTLMGEDCKVTVEIGKGTLDFDKEESRAGYYRSDSESNLLIATFSGTIDGYEEVNRIQVDNVKAGEWRKIHYDIKRPEPGSETGGVTPSVTLDASCQIIDHLGNVTIDEEVIEDPNPIDPGTDPDPDPDPQPTDAPKITSSTIKLGTPVTVTEGLQVSVDITSSDKNGLTGLVVDIESPTLTPDELAGMGLASHLDLVNPGDLKTAIEGLGFPTGSNVLNQSKVTFDISDFMPLLGLLGAGTHNFIIKATDAQGTTTETLILVTE